MQSQHEVSAPAHTLEAPGTGAGAEANTLGTRPTAQVEPMAVVVITIRRDRIEQVARLLMGGTHSASRVWERAGRCSWQSRDPDFGLHEERLGLELAEYMEALDLPTRVADMLPRPAQNPGEGFARALEEVRRG